MKGDYRYTDADGDSIDESFEFDGTCITTSNSDEDDENCLDDETARFGIKEAFVVVVKEDGRWAVSPMETLIEYGRTVLAEVDDNLVRRFTNSMHEVEKVERVDLNDQFDAELNDAGWATYEVDLEENQTISVEVDESDLDGYASSTVFDPDGKELEGYDSITAPSDGTYRVVIEVDSFKEETVPVTLAAVPEEQIELGSEVDASLDSDTPVRDFVFEGEAGDSIEITIDDSNLDLEVLDPDGVTIYSDEGDVYELDRSGTYRVRVRSYDGESADFSLLVQPPPLFLVDGEKVTSVEGSLTDAFDIEYYSIEVRAGAELTLTITPDPLFDPMISIYDPDSVISEENAAGPGVKEVFELSADTNGTWYLEVSTPADVAGGFKLDIVEVN